jgi:hypothetical protein
LQRLFAKKFSARPGGLFAGPLSLPSRRAASTSSANIDKLSHYGVTEPLQSLAEKWSDARAFSVFMNVKLL